MKLTDGDRSGDSEEFIDLVEEDKPLLKDDETSESDSYGDDEFYSEDEIGEKGENMEYIDLNSICEDIRKDVKDCFGYIGNQSGIFWRRLKEEWNELVFGDSYEYDFQGTGTIGESLEEL